MRLINVITTIGIAAITGALIYIGKKLQTLDDLQTTTNKIKLNLKVVSDYLTGSRADFNHQELQAYSPLKLTADGKKLIANLGFDTVFKKHQQDFFRHMDSENPKLKYDVERAAIRSVSGLYDQDYMEFLKVFFYNNPSRNLQNVAPTLGIYIRDKYLNQHPEINE